MSSCGKLPSIMTCRRRALARVVGIWLMCQTIGAAAVPLANLSWQTAMDAGECDCPLAALGQACPMHHTKQGKRQCVLDKASSSSSFVLMSLLGNTGVMPPTQATNFQAVAAESIPAVTRALASRSDRPESPPPRS
jgi:hypothetical protein